MLFQVANANIVGTATGFFFEYSNDIYLITNRHIVDYSIKEDNPKLIFQVHTSEYDLTQSKTIELPLKENGNLTWYGYEESEIDIVAIPISKELINDAVIKSFSETDFPPRGIELPIGMDLLVVGYPRGFTDPVNFTPISKSCMISTPINVPFENEPFFLMDGELFKGMSGSAVITKPSTTFVINGETSFYNEYKIFFLGIHSASVSKTIGMENEPIYGLKNGQIIIEEFKQVPVDENLELQTCWFNGMIINLIKSIKQ